MVFKGRFFSYSSKRSDSSDGSNNSPKTPPATPNRSDGKKKNPTKDDNRRTTTTAATSSTSTSTSRQTTLGRDAAATRHQKHQQKKKKNRGKDIDDDDGDDDKNDSLRRGGVAIGEGKKLHTPPPPPPPAASSSSFPSSTNKGSLPSSEKGDGSGSSGSLAPILASSLGLNRIKTRSGPLPMEGGSASRRGSTLLGPTTFSRGPSQGSISSTTTTSSSNNKWMPSSNSSSGKGTSTGKKKALADKSVTNKGAHTRGATVASPDGIEEPKELSSSSSADVRFATPPNCEPKESATATIGHNFSSWNQSQGLRNSDAFNQSAFDDCETPKESESPRFKAIMDATSVPKKRLPADIKSFSHELNSKGVRPYPFWKPRGINNLKEVLKVIQIKFEKAKEEVNSDLKIFAGELVGIIEKNVETHPEWEETLEDLLLLARSCVVTTPGDFWLQCEGIVQDLDDRRQEVPMGLLKKLHTRMLFILTRCTRLLQFHKESVFAEDELVLDHRENKMLHFSEERPTAKGIDEYDRSSKNGSELTSSRKSYSQEQHILNWRKSHEIKSVNFFPASDVDSAKISNTHLDREKLSSWKRFPPRGGEGAKESDLPIGASVENDNSLQGKNGRQDVLAADLGIRNSSESTYPKESESFASKHKHNVSWGYWGDQPSFSEDMLIMCRICEEYVPTSHVEDHLKVCTVADRCDQQGLNVDDRFIRIAETLEKLVELSSQLDTQPSSCSPDVLKANSSVPEEPDVPSPKLSCLSRRGSADMIDYFQEADVSVSIDDLKGFPSMTCKTRFGPKSDHGMATSSAGSMTPRSPLLTPRTSHIDSILAGKSLFAETNDLPQIIELADIARCIASTAIDDEQSLPYMVSCLEDLQEVVDRRKHEALTVQTFGARIEKLHREKYLQLCDAIDVEKVDVTSTVMDEEDDVVRSLRNSPVHSTMRDRTSIDDFEIIKPISRGAFGRVFLAKKRTTGDLFAIKVLKKADMIRKNAVESILAERDILITVRNPFVVRFFYSFTSRENLYLVMEYLNGGDLYSLLRNLGCLDEEVARIYVAEVVLALEYLHSLRVVHRDLKPDNLLIAHDGHVKLTDFGLSKVGLINSTDDLSGPAGTDPSLMGEDEPQISLSEHQRERRKKRSAVGTPDYLAPEILLGTGHGTTADWWSVGVILYELLVGIPPFNAEHPQIIFDNILNCKIPWPRIPEEMGLEAHDLIDKLLTEDPNQRLGARGASEVKQHPFFKDINWDTLARQKAAFVPSSDSALDTSYFTCRYSWNPSDERIHEASEFEDSSGNESFSGSSCVSNHHDEVVDDCGEDFADLESASSVNYSFSNFSFKNLSQLASINYELLSKGWKEEPHPSSAP